MLEEIYEKFKIVDGQFYKLTDLYNVLLEAGLIKIKRNGFTNAWWNRKILRGQLIVTPKTFSHENWGLTGKQLKEIVNAFLPGGAGFYDLTKK
jgi:hypothetical protein